MELIAGNVAAENDDNLPLLMYKGSSAKNPNLCLLMLGSPESDFVCGCVRWMRSACAGEPGYQEYEGKRYCVLHFPSKEKAPDFKKVFQRKLENKDFNFAGVWFPDEVSFAKVEFGTKADFSLATFTAAADFHFAKFGAAASFYSAIFTATADFRFATFSAAANFVEARFSAAADFNLVKFGATASFSSATFGAAADFGSVTFSADAVFYKATFNKEANFSLAIFTVRANFNSATLGDRVRFAGDKYRQPFPDTSELYLRFIRIESPDHISFHTLKLRPRWFVNVDARKFDFTNVEWRLRTVNEEIGGLQGHYVSSPHNLLFIACQRLADNAEENHRYEEASWFRYLAMEAKRLEHSAPGRLSWWYWLASGYGERALRAFLVLIGVCAAFASLYLITGHVKISEPKGIKEYAKATLGAFNYSLQVMTLQRPDKPMGVVTPILNSLETILGPVQAALLALAIRRKFMR